MRFSHRTFVLGCRNVLGEENSKGEEKANRDNPKIKNRRNHQQTKDIPKVNRDKIATSASPHFRPSFENRHRMPRRNPHKRVRRCAPNAHGRASRQK